MAFAPRFADTNDTTTWTTSGRISAVCAVVEEKEARLKALNEKKQAGFSLEQPTRCHLLKDIKKEMSLVFHVSLFDLFTYY